MISSRPGARLRYHTRGADPEAPVDAAEARAFEATFMGQFKEVAPGLYTVDNGPEGSSFGLKFSRSIGEDDTPETVRGVLEAVILERIALPHLYAPEGWQVVARTPSPSPRGSAKRRGAAAARGRRPRRRPRRRGRRPRRNRSLRKRR